MNVFLNSGSLQENEDCVSSIVQLGDFFYLSAQLGKGDSITEQAVSVCNEIVEVLSEFDLRFDHVVKFTVYLKNLKDKEEFLSVFKNYLEKPFPAVSFVGVNDLDNGAMLAVEGQGINTLRHEQAHKNSSCSHGCSGCDGSCG